VRGWEPTIAAQARIVGAVEKILSQPGDSDLAIIGHAGSEPCYTVTSLDCQSIAAMVSQRQMAETGSPSTAPAGGFWITAGGQLRHQRETGREPARPDASPDGFGVLAPPPHDTDLTREVKCSCLTRCG
jgi:hypothetical protein